MAIWNGTTGSWQSLELDNFTVASSAQGVDCVANDTSLIVSYLILDQEFTNIGIAILSDDTNIVEFISPQVDSEPGVCIT